jgi:hypothetical protein
MVTMAIQAAPINDDLNERASASGVTNRDLA